MKPWSRSFWSPTKAEWPSGRRVVSSWPSVTSIGPIFPPSKGSPTETAQPRPPVTLWPTSTRPPFATKATRAARGPPSLATTGPRTTSPSIAQPPVRMSRARPTPLTGRIPRSSPRLSRQSRPRPSLEIERRPYKAHTIRIILAIQTGSIAPRLPSQCP